MASVLLIFFHSFGGTTQNPVDLAEPVEALIICVQNHHSLKILTGLHAKRHSAS